MDTNNTNHNRKQVRVRQNKTQYNTCDYVPDYISLATLSIANLSTNLEQQSNQRHQDYFNNISYDAFKMQSNQEQSQESSEQSNQEQSQESSQQSPLPAQKNIGKTTLQVGQR